MDSNLTGRPVQFYTDRNGQHFEIARVDDSKWVVCCHIRSDYLCLLDNGGMPKRFSTPEECVALFADPGSDEGFTDLTARVTKFFGGQAPIYLSDESLRRLGSENQWSPDNSMP